MKLTSVIQIYKSICPTKNGLNSINILNTGSHKIFQYITAYGGEILKHILVYLYCTKYNEMKAFREMYKSMFRIQDHTKVL